VVEQDAAVEAEVAEAGAVEAQNAREVLHPAVVAAESVAASLAEWELLPFARVRPLVLTAGELSLSLVSSEAAARQNAREVPHPVAAAGESVAVSPSGGERLPFARVRPLVLTAGGLSRSSVSSAGEHSRGVERQKMPFASAEQQPPLYHALQLALKAGELSRRL
jgi:hypothetical protein